MPARSEARSHWNFPPPRRILVPLDGSVRAECALPVAREIARRTGAELILAHVVDKPTLSDHPMLTRSDQDLARKLRETLDAQRPAVPAASVATGHRLRPTRSHHPEQASDAGRAVADIAERESVDLLVLSAHGVTCDPNSALGRLALHLLQASEKPQLLVQDPLQRDARRNSPKPSAPRPPLAEGRLTR